MGRKRRPDPALIDDDSEGIQIEGYEELEKIGEGGFGSVYKARHRLTNQIVAVKKTGFELKSERMPSSTVPEISLLKELRHPNIVRFICNNFSRGLLIVTPRVIHRDLKPGNLLIDWQTNSLKIADFGLARAISIPVRPITPWGMSLWYEAPEILLGARLYSLPCDVWSIGCIFAEMVNQRPLFPGKSEIDQLFKIFRVTGSPTEDCWPRVTSLPFFKSTFPKWPPKDMSEVVPNLEAAGHDLLFKMLQLDPKR